MVGHRNSVSLSQVRFDRGEKGGARWNWNATLSLPEVFLQLGCILMRNLFEINH